MDSYVNPSAGKTPNGKRGVKPQRAALEVRTAGGAMLWKQVAAIFGAKKGEK